MIYTVGKLILRYPENAVFVARDSYNFEIRARGARGATAGVAWRHWPGDAIGSCGACAARHPRCRIALLDVCPGS